MASSFDRSGRVFVNGGIAKVVGPMVDPMPLNWNRAQLVQVPASMLHVGDNELTIQMRTHRYENGELGALRVGLVADVVPLFERRVLWQNDLVEALTAMTAGFGLVVLGVWLFRRSETTYFWFGCACWTWVIVSVDFFAAYPPLPSEAWEHVVLIANIFRGPTMYTFMLRYAEKRMPKVEIALWVYVAAGVCGLLGTGPAGEWLDIYYFGSLVAAPFFAYVVVREALKRSRVEAALICCAATSQGVLSLYDVWLYGAHHGERVFLAQYTVPLFLFVVGLVLIRHFVASLRGFEQLNADLEKRVAAKSDELAENYERLAEARRAETLAIERSRIMSEMHDGIGSQLTTALAMVRKLDGETSDGKASDGPIARVLRESIDDLQLIVDSLEPVEQDLLTVLGTLRYRLQSRLTQAGVELAWRVTDLPPMPVLTPHSVLSILRVIQEAFANALKHSGARRIEVVTGLLGDPGDDEVAFVCVVDDGRGMKDVQEGGRGLNNMRLRAQSIGGSLSIESAPGRTEVLLVFPTLREAVAA